MNIIETNLKFKDLILRNLNNIKDIILHHSDSNSASPEDIHSWHLNNGWSGAGYQYLVRKNGNIYRLRPDNVVGSHAQGHNSNSIGICFEGNFEVETMNEVQKQAGIELVNYLKSVYNISNVLGHRDVNATSCPGKNFPFEEITNGKVTNNEIIKDTNKISNVQNWVNHYEGINISVDGIFGNETKKALITALQIELNKQINANLQIDGIFGNNTKGNCVNLKKGMKGNITKILQGILICRGYDLKFDGIFGNDTENKVKQFQQNNGLIIDGIAGKNTFAKLFE